MEGEILLRIVLETPPSGVDYGVQKGSGNSYSVEQKQQSTGGDLSFEFAVRLKQGKNPAECDFAGPFVQGPIGQRFVYIDIGKCAGQQEPCWSRRLKIPLTGVTPEMVKGLNLLETRVAGTAKDGSPTCATVKPFAGWKGVR